MSDDQFTKLFKYIEEFRTDVDKKFEEASKDHADIRGAIIAQCIDRFGVSWLLNYDIPK